MVAPGGTVQVQVLYDADPGTPGDQPIAGGLFREGFSVTYASGGVFVSTGSGVELPAVMDSPIVPNGQIIVGTNSSFAVAVQESSAAPLGYDDTLLGTAVLNNYSIPGTYPLTLGPNSTGAPNFLDFATQTSQDAGISWGTATVTVTPEPAGLGLLACGLAAMLPRRPRPR